MATKRAHIVYAHIGPKSLNEFLRDKAVSLLSATGWTVTVTDLYEDGFKCSLDKADFPLYTDSQFCLQDAQAQAIAANQIPADILSEMSKLEAASLIVFQYPIYLMNVPAVLLGYLSRVLYQDWAYGKRQALAFKKVLMSCTAGLEEEVFVPGKRGPWNAHLHGLCCEGLGHLGVTVLEPIVMYGFPSISEDAKYQYLQKYEQCFREIDTRKEFESYF